MSKPSLTVIVTVLNEMATIQQLLDALMQQRLLPKEVIITDGGSSDGTWEWLQQLAQAKLPFTLKALSVPGNRSRGRNAAISKAKHQVIAITDAGCIPQPSWLAELWRAYQDQNRPVIAGYYEARPKSPFEEAVVPYVLVMPDRVKPSTFLPATRSMLIEKNVWAELGGFDETLSDNEDYALAKKMEKQHVDIGFTSKAKVVWLPRTSLKQFMWMIYRFARGDVQSGIIRLKVLLIFFRVTLWVLISLGLLVSLPSVALLFWLVSSGLYWLWAIQKNMRYVPNGWYWLPILQVTSDIMVITGSVEGWLKRFLKA